MGNNDCMWDDASCNGTHVPVNNDCMYDDASCNGTNGYNDTVYNDTVYNDTTNASGCMNTNQNTLNSNQEGCWYYDQNPGDCSAQFDTDAFTALAHCCACG